MRLLSTFIVTICLMSLGQLSIGSDVEQVHEILKLVYANFQPKIEPIKTLEYLKQLARNEEIRENDERIELLIDLSNADKSKCNQDYFQNNIVKQLVSATKPVPYVNVYKYVEFYGKQLFNLCKGELPSMIRVNVKELDSFVLTNAEVFGQNVEKCLDNPKRIMNKSINSNFFQNMLSYLQDRTLQTNFDELLVQKDGQTVYRELFRKYVEDVCLKFTSALKDAIYLGTQYPENQSDVDDVFANLDSESLKWMKIGQTCSQILPSVGLISYQAPTEAVEHAVNNNFLQDKALIQDFEILHKQLKSNGFKVRKDFLRKNFNISNKKLINVLLGYLKAKVGDLNNETIMNKESGKNSFMEFFKQLNDFCGKVNLQLKAVANLTYKCSKGQKDDLLDLFGKEKTKWLEIGQTCSIVEEGGNALADTMYNELTKENSRLDKMIARQFNKNKTS